MIEVLYRHQAYPSVREGLDQSAGKLDSGQFESFPGPRYLIRPIETFGIVTDIVYFRGRPSQNLPLSYNSERHSLAPSKRRRLLC